MLYLIYQVREEETPIYTGKTTPKGLAVIKHRKIKDTAYTFHVMEEDVPEHLTDERILFYAGGTRCRIKTIKSRKCLIKGRYNGNDFFFKSLNESATVSGISRQRIRAAISRRTNINGWTFQDGEQ